MKPIDTGKLWSWWSAYPIDQSFSSDVFVGVAFPALHLRVIALYSLKIYDDDHKAVVFKMHNIISFECVVVLLFLMLHRRKNSRSFLLRRKSTTFSFHE